VEVGLKLDFVILREAEAEAEAGAEVRSQMSEVSSVTTVSSVRHSNRPLPRIHQEDSNSVV